MTATHDMKSDNILGLSLCNYTFLEIFLCKQEKVRDMQKVST